MTEPEELEEDLFADLYDGDDAPAKPEPPAQQDLIPEPAEAPAPTEYAPPPNATSEETKTEPAAETIIKDEHMFGNGQNGDVGNSWNSANGGQSNQYNNTGMDHEPAQIGIKEDGCIRCYGSADREAIFQPMSNPGQFEQNGQDEI